MKSLFGAYMMQIKDYYQVSPNDHRLIIIHGLEQLIQTIDIKGGKESKIEEPTESIGPAPKRDKYFTVGFNPNNARETRTKSGLSGPQVCNEIWGEGTANRYCARIYSAERKGIRNTHSKFAIDYIAWLEQHGYKER